MRAATTSLISGEPWWTEAKGISFRHQFKLSANRCTPRRLNVRPYTQSPKANIILKQRALPATHVQFPRRMSVSKGF
jgi:hypothetical protein